MSQSEIVPLDAVRDVILALTAEQKADMITRLREELDPPVNIAEKFELDGQTYTATILTNAWVVIYREDPARALLHPRGKKIVLFDLLDPQSALYCGYGLFT